MVLVVRNEFGVTILLLGIVHHKQRVLATCYIVDKGPTWLGGRWKQPCEWWSQFFCGKWIHKR
eukprot:2530143-Amphidinium_carterae.1